MNKTGKFISILLIMSMFLGLTTSVSANTGISVYIDNEKVSFDVQPRLIGGRTMVPLRAIFEALGAIVQWDESTRTVTAYNEAVIVKATIDVNIMTVNNEETALDVPPMLVGGRTLVPARFVAEAFGCDVQWDANARSVYITTVEIDYGSLEQGANQGNASVSLPGIMVAYDGTQTLDYGVYTGSYLLKFEEDDGNYVCYYSGADDEKMIAYCEALEQGGWIIEDYYDAGDTERYLSIYAYLGGSRIVATIDWKNDMVVIIYNGPEYYPRTSVMTYTRVTGEPLYKTESYYGVDFFIYDVTSSDDIIMYCDALQDLGWTLYGAEEDELMYTLKFSKDDMLVYVVTFYNDYKVGVCIGK